MLLSDELLPERKVEHVLKEALVSCPGGRKVFGSWGQDHHPQSRSLGPLRGSRARSLSLSLSLRAGKKDVLEHSLEAIGRRGGGRQSTLRR